MINRTLLGMAALLPAIVALSVPPALSEPSPCEDPLIRVDAAEPETAVMTCEAAGRAKTLLGTCGLTQTSAIEIAIVDVATHPSFGTCMAVFDHEAGCLRVTDPGRLSALLPDGDARAQLPPSVLFGGVVAHELAHALLDQSSVGIDLGPAEEEFVANAFELESLDPEWRRVLLDADPVDPTGSEGLVHPAIYALAPRVFANNAWSLFHRDGNGCALVEKIASGTFRFPRH